MQEEHEKDEKDEKKLPRRNFLKKLTATTVFVAPIINSFNLQANPGPDSPWWWWTGHHHHHSHHGEGPPAPPPPPPPQNTDGEWN